MLFLSLATTPEDDYEVRCCVHETKEEETCYGTSSVLQSRWCFHVGAAHQQNPTPQDRNYSSIWIMNEFEGDIFNDYELRESIIREMSEQELWETPETLPEDLLAGFWGNHLTKCHTTPGSGAPGGYTIFIPNEATPWRSNSPLSPSISSLSALANALSNVLSGTLVLRPRWLPSVP